MSEGGGTVIGTGLPQTIEAIDEILGGRGIFGIAPTFEASPSDFPVFDESGNVIGLTDPRTGDVIPVTSGSEVNPNIIPSVLGGNILQGFGEPPIAITQFPVDPPISVTQFPTTPEITTIPATTAPTNVFDVFGSIFQGISNQASSLLSLGLQFFGPTPQPIPVGAGAVAQPVGGAPVPIHAAIGRFLADTATVTLEGLVEQAPAILGAVFGPTQPVQQLPGGLSPGPLAPGGGFGGGQLVSAPISMPGGARTAGFDLPFVDVVPQGAVCITPRATGSFRLPSRVDVPVPQRDGTMRFTTFKNMGRPILWSGDLAAVKRVRRVASKARRRVGGR